MLRLIKNRTGTNKLSGTTLKLWIKQDLTDDDTLINSLITESRIYLENYLNMSLITTSITGITDQYEFNIPYGPLNNLYSVKSKSEQTDLEYTNLDGKLIITTGVYNDLIEFIYDAGVDNIDDSLILLWKQTCSFLYTNRGDIDINQFLKNNTIANLSKRIIWI